MVVTGLALQQAAPRGICEPSKQRNGFREHRPVMCPGADEFVGVAAGPEHCSVTVGPSADEDVVPAEPAPVIGQVFVELVVEVQDDVVTVARA